MNLYATTTSERASKGQGGNEYLNIQIYDEFETTLAIISILPTRKDLQEIRIDYDRNISEIVKIPWDNFDKSGRECSDGNCWSRGDNVNCPHRIKAKGNKQKKAKCAEVHDLLDIGCELEH